MIAEKSLLTKLGPQMSRVAVRRYPKRIKYNHLVTNCLIFYNIVEMSRIIRELIHEGHTIAAEAVASLRPFLTRHVNRLGQYSLNLNRKYQSLDFKALMIP